MIYKIFGITLIVMMLTIIGISFVTEGNNNGITGTTEYLIFGKNIQVSTIGQIIGILVILGIIIYCFQQGKMGRNNTLMWLLSLFGIGILGLAVFTIFPIYLGAVLNVFNLFWGSIIAIASIGLIIGFIIGNTKGKQVFASILGIFIGGSIGLIIGIVIEKIANGI